MRKLRPSGGPINDEVATNHLPLHWIWSRLGSRDGPAPMSIRIPRTRKHRRKKSQGKHKDSLTHRLSWYGDSKQVTLRREAPTSAGAEMKSKVVMVRSTSPIPSRVGSVCARSYAAYVLPKTATNASPHGMKECLATISRHLRL